MSFMIFDHLAHTEEMPTKRGTSKSTAWIHHKGHSVLNVLFLSCLHLFRMNNSERSEHVAGHCRYLMTRR